METSAPKVFGHLGFSFSPLSPLVPGFWRSWIQFFTSLPCGSRFFGHLGFSFSPLSALMVPAECKTWPSATGNIPFSGICIVGWGKTPSGQKVSEVAVGDNTRKKEKKKMGMCSISSSHLNFMSGFTQPGDPHPSLEKSHQKSTSVPIGQKGRK